MLTMDFGDHFSYVGGSFTLTPEKLQKAINIAEKELEKYKQRLDLWENNPKHESFAHDMKWHGADTIDMLVRNHVKAGERNLERLKALNGSQLKLELEV